MQTRTPAPVEPPKAHSRVTSAGQPRSQADAVDGVGREAPRWEFLVGLVQDDVGDVESSHAPDSISAVQSAAP